MPVVEAQECFHVSDFVAPDVGSANVEDVGAFSFEFASKLGPIFEMRTYTFCAGELPVIMDTWRKAIDVRLKFGPLVAAWYSELGALNKFIHIWPYASLNERMEIREKAHATGNWPAGRKAVKEGGRDYELEMQENKILMPSGFSPLQ